MFVPPQRGGEQHSFKERTKPILINFTTAEEVINFTPAEEVINYIPAEEPIKREAYKGKLD